jgi:sugar phosphate permease
MALSTYLLVLLKTAMEASTLVTCSIVFLIGFFSFAVDSLISGSFLQDFCEKSRVLHLMGAISGVVGGVGAAGSIAQGYLTVALSEASWDHLFSLLAALTALAGVLMWQPLVAEIRADRSHKQDSAAA